MPSRGILFGLTLTAGAAVTALLLTTAFSISSEGPLIRIVLGGLITTAELVFLIRRQRFLGQSEPFSSRDAILSVVFILATTLGLCRWVEYTLVRSLAVSDFAQDYVAAYALRHGIDIFGPNLRALGLSLLQFEKLDNYHPPFTALLFLPFSFLHFPWAFMLWNVFSLLIYVGLVLLLLQSYGLLTARWLRLSSVLLLWEPFTSSIFLGQLSVALSFAIIFSHLLLQIGRDRLAGVLLGLATLVKLYPGLILLYLVSQRRWRCSVVFVVTLISGLLMMILSMGSETLMYYIRNVIPEQTRVFANSPLNISVGSVIKTLFEPTIFSLPPFPFPVVGQVATLAISGLLISAVALFSYYHNETRFADDIFSLFCITMLLTSPITWYHSCILLLLPLALLTRAFVRQETDASSASLLLILILCGIPNQDLIDGFRGASEQLPWYVVLACRTGFFGLLYLYWVFWKRLARSIGVSSCLELMRSLGLRILHP